MNMPTVRNNFCHKGLIRAKIRLLSTALSKLNVTSKIARTTNSHSALSPPYHAITIPRIIVKVPEIAKIRNGCDGWSG